MSPGESRTWSDGLTTTPQRRLDGRSKQVAEICHDLAYRGFSEGHVDACARIWCGGAKCPIAPRWYVLREVWSRTARPEEYGPAGLLI